MCFGRQINTAIGRRLNSQRRDQQASVLAATAPPPIAVASSTGPVNPAATSTDTGRGGTLLTSSLQSGIAGKSLLGA